jgi:hypothetical protein
MAGEKMSRNQLKNVEIVRSWCCGAMAANTVWCAVYAHPWTAVASGVIALVLLILVIAAGLVAAERK